MPSLEEKKKTAKKLKSRKTKKYDSVSYLTGDIGLNIDHFNKRMGTFGIDSDVSGSSCSSESSAEASGDAGLGGGMGEAAVVTTSKETLEESKRYVRRYYIRPQNIFCSNKAEILKALIELDDENCSVYTLNNLGDEKDVSKLMSNDIIYYYDKGILYDKNHVKVMDYDLSIKKEENRKHFANVNRASDKEFKNAYEDRMTDATELEEAFSLTFDSVNVFGEKLTEAKESFCCICGEPLEGYGNNPEPFMSSDEGRCCDACNLKFIIPLRMEMMREAE